MPSALQPKILRALQERNVTPVGGKATPVDVRVIAATHRDLRQRVEEGAFREDLYYRLFVVPLHLPPLRERIADIVPLAEHFLGAAGKTLSPEAAARLLTHAWPGNVRELKNAIERAAVLARGARVGVEDLDFLTHRAPGAALDWPEEDIPAAIERLERFLIGRALNRSQGNRAEAARALGIHRQLLYAKIRRYGLEASGERTDGVCEADAPLDSKEPKSL
jgi:two-component system NtrC family response regulator